VFQWTSGGSGGGDPWSFDPGIRQQSIAPMAQTLSALSQHSAGSHAAIGPLAEVSHGWPAQPVNGSTSPCEARASARQSGPDQRLSALS
jgi:hypothetical protein